MDDSTLVSDEPSEDSPSHGDKDLKRISKIPYMNKYEKDFGRFESMEDFNESFVPLIFQRIPFDDEYMKQHTTLEYKKDELVIKGNGPKITPSIKFENGELVDWSEEWFFIKNSAQVFTVFPDLPRLTVHFTDYTNGEELHLSVTKEEIDKHFGFDVYLKEDEISEFILTDIDNRWREFNDKFVEIK